MGICTHFGCLLGQRERVEGTPQEVDRACLPLGLIFLRDIAEIKKSDSMRDGIGLEEMR
jgi:hypothetical protein